MTYPRTCLLVVLTLTAVAAVSGVFPVLLALTVGVLVVMVVTASRKDYH